MGSLLKIQIPGPCGGGDSGPVRLGTGNLHFNNFPLPLHGANVEALRRLLESPTDPAVATDGETEAQGTKRTCPMPTSGVHGTLTQASDPSTFYPLGAFLGKARVFFLSLALSLEQTRRILASFLQSLGHRKPRGLQRETSWASGHHHFPVFPRGTLHPVLYPSPCPSRVQKITKTKLRNRSSLFLVFFLSCTFVAVAIKSISRPLTLNWLRTLGGEEVGRAFWNDFNLSDGNY